MKIKVNGVPVNVTDNQEVEITGKVEVTIKPINLQATDNLPVNHDLTVYYPSAYPPFFTPHVLTYDDTGKVLSDLPISKNYRM